jgi:hypothetical protein
MISQMPREMLYEKQTPFAMIEPPRDTILHIAAVR